MFRKTLILALGFMTLFFTQCSNQNTDQGADPVQFIKDQQVSSVTQKLMEKHESDQHLRIEKGVQQVANFWRKSDGTSDDFEQFCMHHFIAEEKELHTVFEKISDHMESLRGNFHQIDVKLKEPLHLDRGPIHEVDRMFAEYDASAHLKQDFFNNKIAFYILLNFPNYSLEKKNKLGSKWSPEEWAYARMGDLYSSRVPSELVQERAKTLTQADSYISEYNIYMGNLRDQDGNTLFPEDLRLITHWGLRDELKSNYNTDQGLEKQEMIYEVMLDIINQDIPEKMINSDEYQWNPFSDKLYEGSDSIEFASEPDTRYEILLNNFHAVKNIDPYQPYYPTYIKRAFEDNMEMSQEEVEKLFTDFVSSPQIKQVAQLIEKRLGRELRPFDIWYNGFSSGPAISEEKLDEFV